MQQVCSVHCWREKNLVEKLAFCKPFCTKVVFLALEIKRLVYRAAPIIPQSSGGDLHAQSPCNSVQGMFKHQGVQLPPLSGASQDFSLRKCRPSVCDFLSSSSDASNNGSIQCKLECFMHRGDVQIDAVRIIAGRFLMHYWCGHTTVAVLS